VRQRWSELTEFLRETRQHQSCAGNEEGAQYQSATKALNDEQLSAVSMTSEMSSLPSVPTVPGVNAKGHCQAEVDTDGWIIIKKDGKKNQCKSHARTLSPTEDEEAHHWPNWSADVAAKLKKCENCMLYHRAKPPRQTPLHPFTAGEPLEVVATDITGKHPKTLRGNKYIVTITDIFSKWSEAILVRNHTASVVAKVLINNVFAQFGAPKRLLSDQGPEFESQLLQELCNRLEIEKIRNSPYQSSTNACVERFHRTLNSMLANHPRKSTRLG